MSKQSKRALAEELKLVEGKLCEVNRQLQSLLEEQSFLENQRDSLRAALNTPDQPDVDWSRTDFSWWVRGVGHKAYRWLNQASA
jgi:hypothetical protein